MTILRITTPYYSAGIEFNSTSTVVGVAPILRWMKQQGWSLERARAWAEEMGYDVDLIQDEKVLLP